MKKLLCSLLCLVMLFSLACGAYAASGEASSSEPAEPTYSVTAEANPDQAITIDGVAMGQVQRLVTTAAIIYDGAELDEELSTMDGVSEAKGVTTVLSDDDDALGVVIRNTGAFVLGGASDPALVAEKINFSFITGGYASWEDFCKAMGYDASKDLDEIAEDVVASGSAATYTNLGLARPDAVVLEDYVIDFTGIGTNDMGGFGAAVYVSDNAVAELNNFRIITRGPCRGTLFTRFDADVTVNDSVLYGVSDPDMFTMQGCPPGLFLEGKIRATNAVGGSCVTYNNSVVVSQGWGALSTDSDSLYTSWDDPTELHINDSYIGVLTSGYGAYSDGGAKDYFTGSMIDVPDYGAVETGAGIVSFEDCYLNVGMYGVMTHSGNSVGDIVFKDSELHVGEAAVMLRDTANKVLIDNCTIAFDGTYTIDAEKAAEYGLDVADLDKEFGTKNGVDESYVHTAYRSGDSNCIVKLIHNSDGGSGTENSGAAPVVTIKNSVMTGDILNTAAMTGDEYTATSGPAGEGVRSPRSLDVTLDGSDITGAISLGEDTWEVTHFASGDTASQEIAYADVTNLGMFREEGYGLSLALTNGSVWTVTEDSYLTSLSIDVSSSVRAGSMTVNGVETMVAPGEYEGEIVLTAATASGEPSGEASGEAAAADEPYPFYAEYQVYVGEKIMADDFMSTMGAYEDAMAATTPYGIPYVDVNSVIGALDYPDWMAENHPGVSFSES